ncbi:MAG: transposase [Pseudomonadota bacterium]
MPPLIACAPGTPIDVAELVEALDTARVDVRDDDSLAALAPLLHRLGANRRFLADRAIAILAGRDGAAPAGGGYGPQVVLLDRPNARHVLRANFWPAAEDAVTRASGEAAFVYGMVHDHPFAFLTHGYLGPGYWSDYFEVDGPAPAGLAGEAVALRPTGRHRLEPGTTRLYRAHRDVHAQLPPDAFSVSLNILFADPMLRWRDQYRFDTARGRIAEVLSATAAEALLTVAVATGDGVDLARHFARHHPVARMRATAIEALAGAVHPVELHPLLERACDDPSPRVARIARHLAEQIPAPPPDPAT